MAERVKAGALPTGTAKAIGAGARVCELALPPLRPEETRDLTHTLFGAAPNVERLSAWLHARTAGLPLYVMETAKRLIARGVIRYVSGMWVLPVERLDEGAPLGLEEALSQRFKGLSSEARGLAECLGLRRYEQPTLALCRLLEDDDDGARVMPLLDELEREDVLVAEPDGYRFSSMAVREALLARVTPQRQYEHHRRLGAALAQLPEATPSTRLEAGWHSLQGGDEARGARQIAALTKDSAVAVGLTADLLRPGPVFEAALEVMKREGRSERERLPLLAAVVYCGYYEDKRWGDLYGDEALRVFEAACGLTLTRRLRPFVGGWLALVVGMLVAVVRFRATRSEAGFPSFLAMLHSFFRTVSVLCGAAALTLDGERAAQVARVLEPFAVLPERIAPRFIHDYCLTMAKCGTEEPALLIREVEAHMARFVSPRFFPPLPAEARSQYTAGLHSARAIVSVFCASAEKALASADVMDASGLAVYAMLASEIRYLFHMNRGELAQAEQHHRRIELSASRFDSAWLAEAWEGAALISVYSLLGDVVALTSVSHRLEALAKTAPKMRLYARLARVALAGVSGDRRAEAIATADAELGGVAPRSFMGWSATQGFIAQAECDRFEFAAARARCERALAHVSYDDHEFVNLFLPLSLSMARAEAGTGEPDLGLARLDALLARFRGVPHPLLQGALHEARATIAWQAGRRELYAEALDEVGRWYRPTRTPALLARYDRLVALQNPSRSLAPPPLPAADQQQVVTQQESARKAD